MHKVVCILERGVEFHPRAVCSLPAFGPFVGLLGKEGADEADDRVTVGEDADAHGAAAGTELVLTRRANLAFEDADALLALG